jgi:hypothetical protein
MRQANLSFHRVKRTQRKEAPPLTITGSTSDNYSALKEAVPNSCPTLSYVATSVPSEKKTDIFLLKCLNHSVCNRYQGVGMAIHECCKIPLMYRSDVSFCKKCLILRQRTKFATDFIIAVPTAPLIPNVPLVYSILIFPVPVPATRKMAGMGTMKNGNSQQEKVGNYLGNWATD